MSPFAPPLFLQQFLFLFLLYFTDLPVRISSAPLSSVTLHTAFYFRDYVTSVNDLSAKNLSSSSSLSPSPPVGWPVLKAIQTIRFYGGDIVADARMIITMFISEQELQEHTSLYHALTRKLRVLNTEFYPQFKVPSSTELLEDSFRTFLLVNMTTSHLLHFHPTNFFVSNPLENLYENDTMPDVSSIICLSGYPAFVDEGCSPRLLLIENNIEHLRAVWTAIASVSISDPSGLVRGIQTKKEPNQQLFNKDSSLLNTALYNLGLVTSAPLGEEKSIFVNSPVIYLDHNQLFDIFFFINDTTSKCEIAFQSVNLDIPEAIASELIQTVLSVPNSCLVLAEHAELLPWLDVTEDGTLKIALHQEPWHIGYSLCSAPYCQVQDEYTNLNAIFQEVWSYRKEGNEMYANEDSTEIDIEKAILYKIGQGVQVLFSGEGSCTGECFSRLVMTSIRKVAYRSTLYSVGYDNELSPISALEKSIDILRRSVVALGSFQTPAASNIIAPCIFHMEISADYSLLTKNYTESSLLARYGNNGSDAYQKLLKSVDEELYRLGYISLTSDSDEYLHSYHILRSGCDITKLDRVKPFVPEAINKFTASYMNSPKKKYFDSAGSTMKCGHHEKEFQTIDNSLPSYVFEQLQNRIKQMPGAAAGSQSYFIPFGDSLRTTHRRTLIEEIIVTQLAPLVLGDVDEAIKDGYLGAEWWIQSRASNTPKEFHLDTAITWCRDNGWSKELLTACHFYPTVGSIYYLSSQGGPTAVFNQSMSHKGMDPILPKELTLIYPRENRLLMFKGNRFHGVLKDKDDMDGSSRDTLLVNYWRDKTAGEKETPTITRDAFLVEEFRDEISGPNHHKYEKHRPKSRNYRVHALDRDFKQDLESWKNQKIPSEYSKMIEKGKRDGVHDSDGFYLFKLRQTDIMNSLNLDGTYQNWHIWEANDTTQSIVVIELPSDREWRKSMPGGDPFGNETTC